MTFDDYLDEVITFAGQTGKRRLIWSIPRVALAREVWEDCVKRNGGSNEPCSRECAEVSGSEVPN